MNEVLREQVLEKYGRRCMLNVYFGIAELTGVPCDETRLELHHITYRRFGNEIIDDLIPVCPRCHDILTTGIRKYRYEARSVDLEDHERLTPKTEGESLESVKTIEVKDTVRTTPIEEKENCKNVEQRIELKDCIRITPTLS